MRKFAAFLVTAFFFFTITIATAQRFKPSTGGSQDGAGATMNTHVQGTVLKNSEATSAAATAQTVSIA